MKHTTWVVAILDYYVELSLAQHSPQSEWVETTDCGPSVRKSVVQLQVGVMKPNSFSLIISLCGKLVLNTAEVQEEHPIIGVQSVELTADECWIFSISKLMRILLVHCQGSPHCDKETLHQCPDCVGSVTSVCVVLERIHRCQGELMSLKRLTWSFYLCTV